MRCHYDKQYVSKPIKYKNLIFWYEDEALFFLIVSNALANTRQILLSIVGQFTQAVTLIKFLI